MLEALTRLPLAPSAYPSLFLLSSLERRDDSGGGSGSRFDDLLRVFQPQREALRGRRRKGEGGRDGGKEMGGAGGGGAGHQGRRSEAAGRQVRGGDGKNPEQAQTLCMPRSSDMTPSSNQPHKHKFHPDKYNSHLNTLALSPPATIIT